MKHVVLLPGDGTDSVRKSINVSKSDAKSLEEAVRSAVQKASSGDKILLSPGFTSFGMFKNEFDRGDQFVELVNNL